MINKKEFIVKMAEENEITKAAAEAMYDAVFKTFGTMVSSGEEVSIPNVGKVTFVERAARKGRNPKTGEEVEIPARVSPKFKFSKNIKDAVAEL